MSSNHMILHCFINKTIPQMWQDMGIKLILKSAVTVLYTVILLHCILYSIVTQMFSNHYTVTVTLLLLD